MKHILCILFACVLVPDIAFAQSFKESIAPLVKESCIGCHDSDTETDLSFTSIDYDLTNAGTFRMWEKVFDRVSDGEMPPESEGRPDPRHVKSALGALENDLRIANLEMQQRVGRVPARRLTKRELSFTLKDLLFIDGVVTSNVPDDIESGSFDTVGANQRISAVHIESYLAAADSALDLAIRSGPNPKRKRTLDFINSKFLNEFHEKPLELGGNVTKRIEDGVVLFRDTDYLITSGAGGYYVSSPGMYRITSDVAAYQSSEPVTMKLIRKGPGGDTTLLRIHDLQPGKTETISVEVFLSPGDSFYTTFQTKVEPFAGIQIAGGAKNFQGPGLAIKKQFVEGPLFSQWPPKSTRQLLGEHDTPNIERSEDAEETLSRIENLIRIVAPRVFRREVTSEEIDDVVDLTRPAVESDRSFVEVLRIPLRSMLSSPQFLMFGGEPGELNDYALANRLSYFLWKSMPDDELFELARKNELSKPSVLHAQVDRMLANDKSGRFVRDFIGQWLRLYQVNATSPDEKLYPEFDELLADAIPKETEYFFAYLIRENLSASNLIDSEFTFLNRRLAEHYRFPRIEGQHFRRVLIPEQSHRGGILTHAAILKTTANGTVTSPVTRGNFVLTNLLGDPPSPPPPNIGSIEPDTRGKTTIREILDAHRNIDTCNQCHREIDPPGFALENFDPIGGFRTRYRANGSGIAGLFGGAATYKAGPKVDPSGITSAGEEFSSIKEFRQHLMSRKEQVAKNLIENLVTYATGAEIQFADRGEIDRIVKRTSENGFLMKDIIHQIVRSDLFRIK